MLSRPRMKKDENGYVYIGILQYGRILWGRCAKFGFNRSALINELLREFLTLYETFKLHKKHGAAEI